MTEQWENSKSSKNTGRTVDKGNKQGISKIKKHRVTNTSDIVGYNEIYALEKVQMMFKVSPESIVFKFIVACHCQQASKCYSQWIENLSCGISPHLKKNIAEKINSTRFEIPGGWHGDVFRWTKYVLPLVCWFLPTLEWCRIEFRHNNPPR